MGLCNDSICRKCGTGEEISVHILCECEALASLRHAYLLSFFLDPEDIRVLGMGAIWNFAKGTGLLQPSTEYGAQRACQLRPRCNGPERARTQYYSILFVSIQSYVVQCISYRNDQQDATVQDSLLFHCSLNSQHVSSDIIAHHQELLSCNYSLEAPDDER